MEEALVALLEAPISTAPSLAAADSYPSKTIRTIVPFGAGGNTQPASVSTLSAGKPRPAAW